MRISEMTPRVVRAEPIEILLRRVKYVAADINAGALEHWIPVTDEPEEVVDLLFDNAAFAMMAEYFGGTQAANEALLGTPYAVMVKKLDGKGEPVLDDDEKPVLEQKVDDEGEPMVGFNDPPNRTKAVQDTIAIATHRDQRAIGAAMHPDLIDQYFTSVLIAIQIGRGVDPSIAEKTVRGLLPMLHVDLGEDLNALAETSLEKTTKSRSSTGRARTSAPEEPSTSSGD